MEKTRQKMGLIYADELHNALKQQRRWIVKREGFINEGYSYDQVHFTIDEIPTVDAEPVRHGHWLFHEEPDGYYHSECSECGQWCDEDVFLKGKWNYCPNCGAKMDEVNE